MNFEQFIEKIKTALKEYFGEETVIKTQQVYKNNGVLLRGICVLEKGKNIAPTVYLNDYYEKYEQGTGFGEVVSKIVRFMEKNRVESNLNVDFFTDYNKVKKKLVLRLINRAQNEELLKQIPYLKFKDLAIVCHCILITEEIGIGSIVIYKQHLKNWDIVEDTLFQDAFENSPKAEPYCILKMSEMMKEVLKHMIEERIDEICEEYETDRTVLLERTLENMVQELEEKNIPMYVLTNHNRYYGAACMVYPGILENIGNILQEDYYILPSSVHEIIFVGKTYCMDPYALNDMIREINRTQVLEEEWLSNHTYLYQRAEQKLISVLN